MESHWKLQKESERLKYQNLRGAAKAEIRGDFIALNILLENKYLKESTATFNLSWKNESKNAKKKKKSIRIKI